VNPAAPTVVTASAGSPTPVQAQPTASIATPAAPAPPSQPSSSNSPAVSRNPPNASQESASEIYQRGKQLMFDGKDEEALVLLDKAYALEPDAQKLFARSLAYSQTGRFPQALKFARELAAMKLDATLAAKTTKLIKRILETCASQNLKCE
jgi:tetratricopeptide (TPR) repeat protein